MTVTSLAVLLVVLRLSVDSDTARLGRGLMFAVWLLPMLVVFLNNAGVALAPLVLTAALIWSYRHAPGVPPGEADDRQFAGLPALRQSPGPTGH